MQLLLGLAMASRARGHISCINITEKGHGLFSGHNDKQYGMIWLTSIQVKQAVLFLVVIMSSWYYPLNQSWAQTMTLSQAKALPGDVIRGKEHGQVKVSVRAS